MTLATLDEAVRPALASRPVHIDPPISPRLLVLASPRRVLALLGALCAFAIAAHFDGGRLLLFVDRPLERWVIAHRSGTLDAIFNRLSFLGSTQVVLIGGAVLALAALPKCRTVAVLAVTATLARPLLEFTLKNLVARDRPDIDRMARGIGYSFPCGHVMAAAVLWGMVPIVVSLYLRSHRVWWITSTLSLVMIIGIGASRVYLGVHWPTDVLGGFIAAGLLLAGLELGYHRLHLRRGCDLGAISVR
jgi:undecaprenyl-diphosphatase